MASDIPFSEPAPSELRAPEASRTRAPRAARTRDNARQRGPGGGESYSAGPT